jgi:hypothetical protein
LASDVDLLNCSIPCLKQRQLKAIDFSCPIPPSPLRITVKALNLWQADTGKIWGTSDKTADYNSHAQCYATVKGDDSKCNIYVAEVIYGATGIIPKAHAEKGETDRYFPYRAAEWAIQVNLFPISDLITLIRKWVIYGHL